MDNYTQNRLAECQTETERQNVLAFLRIEKKEKSSSFDVKLHEHRQARKYEQVLRRIRLHIFDYEDESPEKYQKARRIMDRCKDRCRAQWKREKARRDDRILQNTPSRFEPGVCR